MYVRIFGEAFARRNGSAVAARQSRSLSDLGFRRQKEQISRGKSETKKPRIEIRGA